MGSSKWDTHTLIINIIWSKGIVNQCDFIDFFIDFEGTMIVENKPRTFMKMNCFHGFYNFDNDYILKL